MASFITNNLRPLVPFLEPVPEPAVTYDNVPKTDEHYKRRKYLGIEDSLLRASVPPRSTTKPRSLQELPRGYRPTRMSIVKDSKGPRVEKTDLWFQTLYVDVYAHARRFAHAHFGFGDIPAPRARAGPDADAQSMWLEGRFSREFLRYAALVARQDNRLGGWEAVLRSEVERTAMVCGILGKALEDGVWDKLLFGASEDQERFLAEQDLATIGSDGYDRTALRAKTIASLLGPDDTALPPNFWPAVDTLTARILTLLLPLLDLLDAHSPVSRAKPLVVVHQDLHRVVAGAALLAVAMRRNERAVFRLVRPRVGDLLRAAEQEHDFTCERVYEASRAKREPEKQAGDVVDEKKDPEQWLLMGAKVKIVLWPGLERYTQIVDKGGKVGVEVYVLRKAMVAYYCSLLSDKGDVEDGRQGLREYVREMRKKKRMDWVRALPVEPWMVMGELLAVVLGLILLLLVVREGGYTALLEGYRQAGPATQTWSNGRFRAGVARIAAPFWFAETDGRDV